MQVVLDGQQGIEFSSSGYGTIRPKPDHHRNCSLPGGEHKKTTGFGQSGCFADDASASSIKNKLRQGLARFFASRIHEMPHVIKVDILSFQLEIGALGPYATWQFWMQRRTSLVLARRAGQTLRPTGQITMTHTLAISLILAPFLVACSSPPKQKYAVDYTVGSQVQLSGVAAKAALINDGLVKPTRVSENSLDKEMRLLRAPMPSMPDQAIRADLSDHVIVDILFNEAGDVESVVPKSYQYPVLLEAVLSVARTWKIDPPVEAGRRVKTTVRQAFRFEVQ